MKQMNWEDARSAHFDLRIFTCGYETRASFVAKGLAGGGAYTIVLDYKCPGVLSYDENWAYFNEIDAVTIVPIDAFLGLAIQSALSQAMDKTDKADTVRVLFDVSSCSRSVMATVLLAIAQMNGPETSVDCVYALSAFDSPPNGELPSHISEPVVGDLSGWSDDLSKPPCAVVGLGFEPGRALGCIDYLEIPEVRLFMPKGPDKRFESAVLSANAALIAEVSETSVLPYDVVDTLGSYAKLESLIFGLLQNYRPVLIPLGPKIFAAMCIVLAIKRLPRVCVWRTSAGSGAEISNRNASGEVAVFTTVFDPPNA